MGQLVSISVSESSNLIGLDKIGMQHATLPCVLLDQSAK